MNILSLENIRTWFAKTNTTRSGMHGTQGDVYVTRLVESLNYCKNHPDSSKCEDLLIQG